MTTGTFGSPRSRRLGSAARAMIVAGLLLGLAAIAIPTTAASARGMGGTPSSAIERATAPAAGPVNLSVNQTDRPAFVPSTLTALPGTTVHLRVTNVGQLNHTFTLLRVANITLPQNWTPSQLDQYFALSPPWVNVSLSAGQSSVVNFTTAASSGGSNFQFVSIVPYQFQAGMSGFLRVSQLPVGPPVKLTVQTTNTLSFVPAILSVNVTSYPVAMDVAVTNLGNSGHTWTLSSLPNYNLSASNFTEFFLSHPPLASPIVPGTPAVVVWGNFTIQSKGVYEFICTVPTHFSSGMFGFLYVGVSPPVQAPPPSNEIVQVAILLGAAGLLGAGIVLATIASLSGRFRSSARPPRP